MIAVVEFISASTAGIVHVELGFIPDYCEVIENHGGTNPNIRRWLNKDRFAGWTGADDAILDTGSTGVLTQDTSSISKYAGEETIAATETANSSPKHVDRAGVAAVAGHVTAAGISIPAGDQTNSGRNLVIAHRNDL